MRGVQLAELRHSWPAWAAVSLSFVVLNFALVLNGLVLGSGLTAISDGELRVTDSAGYVWSGGLNIAMCTLVGLSVVGTASSLVVDSRRGALARLALAGATPGQIRRTISVQLVATSLASAVLGAAAAAAVLPAQIDLIASDRAGEGAPPPEPRYALWPIALGVGISLAISVIGGSRQARRAGANRAGRGAAPVPGRYRGGMPWRRWVLAVVVLLGAVGCFAALPAMTASRTKETVSNTLQVNLVLFVLLATFFVSVAPVLVRPLTQGWTTLVPSRAATWQIARRTVTARADRLVRSVIPIMFTVAMVASLIGMGGTLSATMAANGLSGVEQVGALSFLYLMGFPIAVAISGGVGVLIMMSRQREADLALFGIVGATPRQRVIAPILEAVIISVTALILALVVALVAGVHMFVALDLSGYAAATRVPYLEIAGAFGLCLVVTVLATTLPTLRSLRMPAPQVIARLVAE